MNEIKKTLEPKVLKQVEAEKWLVVDKHKSSQRDLMSTLVFRHISLAFLSYCGFIRMVAGHELLQIPLLFSHTFEILITTGPLMAIQIINNNNLGKFDHPLDTLNLVFFILSLVDFLI